MSSSAVNMYRLVIVAIFAAVASGVLTAEPEDSQRAQAVNCTKKPEYLDLRKDFTSCFNETVNRYLNPTIPATQGCQNFTDVEKKLDAILTFPARACDMKNVNINATILKSLMRFSLQGEAFKKFYSKIECVKTQESNMSNNCVKGHVGYFNITRERKHMTWFVRANVFFNAPTCTKGLDVQNCLSAALINGSCGTEASNYVTSLSEHVRELGNCKNFNSTHTGPQIAEPKKSWFTTPVKITVGVGAAVVGIAITIVLVLKFKNK